MKNKRNNHAYSGTEDPSASEGVPECKNNSEEICANCGHRKESHREGIFKGSCQECGEELSICEKFIPKNNHTPQLKKMDIAGNPEGRTAPANTPEGDVGALPMRSSVPNSIKNIPSDKEPEDVPDEAPDKDSGSETLSDKIEKLEKGCGNSVNYSICKDKYLCVKCKSKLQAYKEAQRIFNDFIKKLEATILFTPSPMEKRKFIEWLLIELHKLAGDLK